MLSTADNELLTRVGPGTPMGEYLRRFWTPIVPAAKLPEPDCDPVEVRILGEDLVAFRDTDGRVGLLQALCPHRQAPLYFGRNEDHGLRCIYHGWKFDTTGACVDMPSEPADTDFRLKVHTAAYPVREKAGILWAYLGPSNKMPAELPHIEWTELPDDQRHFILYEQMCNFVQAIEGDIDSSHIGFLHRNPVQAATTGPSEVQYRLGDLAPRWVVEPTDYGLMLAAQRNAGDGGFYWRTNQWMLPYFTLVAGDAQGKLHPGEMYVPIDDTHTQVWAVRWSLNGPLSEVDKYTMTEGPMPLVGTLDPTTGRLRANKANHFLQDRRAQRHGGNFSGIYGVREQDTAVVEGMGEIVDRTREHLGTSDMAIIGMRRALLNGAKALLRGQEPAIAHQPAAYAVHAWSAVIPQDREGFMDNPQVKGLMVSPTLSRA